MNQLIAFMMAHPVEWSAILLFGHHVFDAAIDSLDPPTPTDGRSYRFIYAFANKLAGNYRQKEK